MGSELIHGVSVEQVNAAGFAGKMGFPNGAAIAGVGVAPIGPPHSERRHSSAV